MCGRFTLTIENNAIANHFNLDFIPDRTASYKIGPSQNILTVLHGVKAEMLRWGLIPYWAKDRKIGSKLINARSETVAHKPSFKDAFRQDRCLIVADGFYEWKKEKDRKQPYYFQMKHRGLFAFAGLRATWTSPEGTTIKSCSILTTKANELVSKIHQRMPVIIKPNHYQIWLKPQIDLLESLEALLVPYDANEMRVDRISNLVNNVRNNCSELLKPLI